MELRAMKRFAFFFAAAALFCSPGFAAGAPIDDLVAKAKQEGALELLAPSTLGPQGAQTLAAAFNKKYGLTIKVNYSPSNNMGGDVARVVTQGASGAPPEWDIMVVTDAHHATLSLRKLPQPFDYAKFGVNPRWIQYDNATLIMANQIG